MVSVMCVQVQGNAVWRCSGFDSRASMRPSLSTLQVIVERAEAGETDPLKPALDLLVDFVAIFVRLLVSPTCAVSARRMRALRSPAYWPVDRGGWPLLWSADKPAPGRLAACLALHAVGVSCTQPTSSGGHALLNW